MNLRKRKSATRQRSLTPIWSWKGVSGRKRGFHLEIVKTQGGQFCHLKMFAYSLSSPNSHLQLHAVVGRLGSITRKHPMVKPSQEGYNLGEGDWRTNNNLQNIEQQRSLTSGNFERS